MITNDNAFVVAMSNVVVGDNIHIDTGVSNMNHDQMTIMVDSQSQFKVLRQSVTRCNCDRVANSLATASEALQHKFNAYLQVGQRAQASLIASDWLHPGYLIRVQTRSILKSSNESVIHKTLDGMDLLIGQVEACSCGAFNHGTKHAAKLHAEALEADATE